MGFSVIIATKKWLSSCESNSIYLLDKQSFLGNIPSENIWLNISSLNLHRKHNMMIKTDNLDNQKNNQKIIKTEDDANPAKDLWFLSVTSLVV